MRRLEDAGAAAIVLRSLFEEQITREQVAAFLHSETHGESFAEALTYFPTPQSFVFGPEEYLEHLGRVKAAVKIPVIASLNGTTPGGWLDYPPLIESTGADALELNLYRLAFDPVPERAGGRARVGGGGARGAAGRAPPPGREAVALLLVPRPLRRRSSTRRGPTASCCSTASTSRTSTPENLELNRTLHLSDARELPLRLRWLGALSGQVRASLAVSGGVHDARDAIKAVMAGAHAVQVVSALLRNGPEYLKVLRQGMVDWMRGVRVGVPRGDARQHEPAAAAPTPRSTSARTT